MLLLAPLGIRALAALAGRAPVAVRLALRDLARYQARSGAALAAASLAVGIAATIAVTAAAQQAHDHTLTGGNLPTDQLIVWLANPNDQGGPGLSVVPAGGATPRAGGAQPGGGRQRQVDGRRDRASARQRHGPRAGRRRRPDTPPVPAGAPPDAGQANLGPPDQRAGPARAGPRSPRPYVATPAILDLYRIPAAVVAAGSDILSSRRDLSGVELGTGFKGTSDPSTVQVTACCRTTPRRRTRSSPQKDMTALRADTAEPVGWLVQANQPITAAQITDARHRAAAAGITIETRTGPDHTLQQLRDYSTSPACWSRSACWL